MSSPRPTVLDTDAFSLLYVRRRSPDPRVAEWKKVLTGRPVLITFQTRTEILSGAMVNAWGAPRMTGLRTLLDRTPTIGVDNSVVETHATLFAECRRIGHALHAKSHTGDRWVAACAIDKGTELLAGDAIFDGVPGLVLLR